MVIMSHLGLLKDQFFYMEREKKATSAPSEHLISSHATLPRSANFANQNKTKQTKKARR
jgi:hypothetical protein